MVLGGAVFRLNLNGNRSLTACIRAKILNLPLGGLHVKRVMKNAVISDTKTSSYLKGNTFDLNYRAQPVNSM
jgi:hypothetical protein